MVRVFINSGRTQCAVLHEPMQTHISSNSSAVTCMIRGKFHGLSKAVSLSVRGAWGEGSEVIHVEPLALHIVNPQ